MMNTEFLLSLIGKSGLKPREAEAVLKAFASALFGELAEGRDVAVFGLGSFRIVETPERQGRTPGTGKPIVIPAGKKVRFAPAKALRDAVNSGR